MTDVFDELRRPLYIGIRRAVAFVSLSQQAANHPDICEMDGGKMKFWGNVRSEQIDDIKREYFESSIRFSLLEVETHFASFLQGCHYVGLRMLVGGKKETAQQAAKLHRAFIGDTSSNGRLEKIAHNFDCTLTWAAKISSLSNARNGIAHSLSYVTPYRTKYSGGKEMRVSWQGLDTFVKDKHGKEHSIESLEGKVMSEAIEVDSDFVDVLLAVRDREKVFQLGDKIKFSVDDVGEICFSYQRAGEEVIEKLKEVAMATGVTGLRMPPVRGVIIS